MIITITILGRCSIYRTHFVDTGRRLKQASVIRVSVSVRVRVRVRVRFAFAVGFQIR